MPLQIKYYGVRGSVPVSGADFTRFGGNTTCCFVRHGDTRIIIDAGTGIRMLGLDLMASGIAQQGGVLHLLFTHTHWDHVQGFPFFVPAFLPNVHLHIYGQTKTFMAPDGKEDVWDIERTLKVQQHFMYFPVDTHYMASQKTYHAIAPGDSFRIDNVRIACLALYHPNTTLAFRFEADNKVFVFSTDVEHNDKMIEELAAFASGADILAYDCQYTTAEYEAGKVGWGHSTYDSAITICQRGKIRELHMIHHDPLHTDNTLLAMEADAKSKFPNAIMIPEGYSCTLG